MDNFTKNILTEWGLTKYIENFEKNEIDKEVLLYMPERDVESLIPEFGPKFKFMSKRKTYLLSQNLNKTIECAEDDNKNLPSISSEDLNSKSKTNQNTDCSSLTSNLLVQNTSEASGFQHITTSQPTTSKVDTSQLENILKLTVQGRDLLQKQTLDESARMKLATEIVFYFLNNNIRLSKPGFESLADQIEAFFEHENSSTYYSKASGGLPARGRLWYKYNNTKKNFTSLKTTKKSSIAAAEGPGSANIDCSELLASLKKIALDDADEWKKSWRESHYARRSTIGDITSYFKEYPVLKTKIGATLISIDFDCLHLTDSNNLIKKWPTLSKVIVLLAKSKSKCADILSKTDLVPPEIRAFILLPYLIKTKNLGKKISKKSQEETASNFILWVSNITDLNDQVTQKKNTLRKLGLRFQPTVVAVGPFENICELYVIIDEIKFAFADITVAVDFCFKTFYALDAKYPIEGESFWLFIQEYIYNIPIEKKLVTVSGLISDLNILIEKTQLDSNIDHKSLGQSDSIESASTNVNSVNSDSD